LILSLIIFSTNLQAYNFINNKNLLRTSPHDPIEIIGNKNFIEENGVISGTGTENDPYIIKEWDIIANSNTGILIRNTSVYFNIENCNIFDGASLFEGIVFINVTNGCIQNNTITNCRNGIMFKTQEKGKDNCEFNKINNNQIMNNKKDGINFEHTAIQWHNNNSIILNNISFNKKGINLIMSNENQIIGNNIYSNIEEAIILFMCDKGGENNIIYHNNIINNGNEQVFEYGDPINLWDNDYPSGGNYWSDYEGEDNNNDGIGDVNHSIPGGVNIDRYPLINPFGEGDLPPKVTIVNPIEGFIHISGFSIIKTPLNIFYDTVSIGGFRLRPVIINATDDIDESENLSVKIFINGEEKGDAIYCCDWKLHEWFWTGFSLGKYKLKVVVEDSGKNKNQCEIEIWNFCILP
jgi:hypothetical protein